jgi:hypothetical protein
MKNEKLELLLNKVVEFNQPDVLYCKGFLYKENDKYYIKVVETLIGNLTINTKYFLKDGDEQYVTQADKPKLMRVSLKSWHYRLIKYILRDNAPTPKTMQNGCPYFWLLVLSMIALPFVLLFKAVKFIIMLVPGFLFWCLEKFVDLWIQSIDDVMAYEMYWGKYDGSSAKLPTTAKIFFNNSDNDFYDYFINEKYGLDRNVNPEEYKKKKEEISAKWEEFRQEREAKRAKEQQESYERHRKENERVAAINARREANKKVWDARMKPIENGIGNLFASIGKVFVSIYNTIKFTGDWKVLIRRTKQVVGAVITLAILVATYFLVNFIAYGIIAFVDFSIANWEIYAILAGIGVFAGIVYIVGVVLGSWIQNIVNNYQRGRKVWYIEPLIYLWYGIKYVGLGIAYAVVYVLWIPVKFIFYTFLWKVVLVNVGLFIWRVLCSLAKGLANSTGVFGEYFGASYSDYCPGIEWTDIEEEQK